MYSDFDSHCPHPYIITDYSEGTDVCDRCGLVIHSQIFVSDPNLRNNQGGGGFFQANNTISDPYTKYNQYIHGGVELLQNVCSTYSISESIFETACSLLHRELDSIKPSKLNVICASVFSKATVLHEAPRTDQEICYMFKIAPKSLGKQNKNLQKPSAFQIDNLKPSDILPRLELPFILTYKAKTKLARQADILYGKVNSSAKTVLAYRLYTYFAKNVLLPKLPIKKVAEICHVSPTSIKRLNKLLKSESAEQENEF